MRLPKFMNDATGVLLISAKPGSRRIKAIKLMTDLTVRGYRVSGGRIGGTWYGAPVLLLDHVGRRTGQPRTTPLLYLRDGERIVVVASRGGSKTTPAWWLNLRERPETTIQIRGERLAVRARRADEAETTSLWPRLVELYPDFTKYQARADRDLPVIVLEPAAGVS